MHNNKIFLKIKSGEYVVKEQNKKNEQNLRANKINENLSKNIK